MKLESVCLRRKIYHYDYATERWFSIISNSVMKIAQTMSRVCAIFNKNIYYLDNECSYCLTGNQPSTSKINFHKGVGITACCWSFGVK